MGIPTQQEVYKHDGLLDRQYQRLEDYITSFMRDEESMNRVIGVSNASSVPRNVVYRIPIPTGTFPFMDEKYGARLVKAFAAAGWKTEYKPFDIESVLVSQGNYHDGENFFHVYRDKDTLSDELKFRLFNERAPELRIESPH